MSEAPQSGTSGAEAPRDDAPGPLVFALRARSVQPSALKPLATGSEPPGDDASKIGSAAGHEPRVFTCLPEPASPERAALQAHETIDMASVLTWIRTFAAPVLVEGVGGWEVPINSTDRVSDLATALALPVVLVAADRLGVLNHTLITVDAIQSRGLEVAGVILNRHGSTDSTLQEWNLADLRRHVRFPVLPFPPCSSEQLESEGEALLKGLGYGC